MAYRFVLPVICVWYVVYVGMIWWCMWYVCHLYVLSGHYECGICVSVVCACVAHVVRCLCYVPCVM